MGDKADGLLTPPAYHIGTSGWQYSHWKGIFYPEQLKSKDWLQFCAQHLNTLELNVTFYRQVRSSTFQKWYDTVPADFLFSVKMSRFITHIKRLNVEEESVRRFLTDAIALKDKLGAILIQLPPSLKYDRALITDFFSLLDPALKYTIEARNKTFINDDFFSLLHDRNIAWCIAESAGRYPYHEALTASFVYLRLHGRTQLYASNYTDEELHDLAAKIRRWARETYVYFDNDFSGYAVQNAITLSSMLLRVKV
ncbi:MAG TPA: DUF72 domain-containing protein [Syntrophorhabdales bacterium]|nr:DUF72 domain-containing protein [Syntrophorhabdales bacterium]